MFTSLPGFRKRVRRHRVRWDSDPFLICRTVTPLALRDMRVRCNCVGCLESRRRTDRTFLSHPLGSFADPPTDKFTFALELREVDVVSKFCRDDAIVTLGMLGLNDDFEFLQPSWDVNYISTWSNSELRDHVTYLEDEYPFTCRESLKGINYRRLALHDSRHKGPRLLMRALRSHSVQPYGHTRLYKIPEKYDRKYDRMPKSELRCPRFPRIGFGLIPGTIEYLIVHKCFYRSKIIFSGGPASRFRPVSAMAPPVKRQKVSSVSLTCRDTILKVFKLMLARWYRYFGGLTHRSSKCQFEI